MGSFRHHPDGFIYINEDFSCTLDEFLSFEPQYKLPKNARSEKWGEFIGREYIQEEFNRLFTSKTETFGNKIWDAGDKYISRINAYKNMVKKLRKKEEEPETRQEPAVQEIKEQDNSPEKE